MRRIELKNNLLAHPDTWLELMTQALLAIPGFTNPGVSLKKINLNYFSVVRGIQFKYLLSSSVASTTEL